MVVLMPGDCLYDALGVSKDASSSDIRKAYHKLAFQLHPDKNPGNAEATERFQTLQKVYNILSDDEKRKVYDQSGSMEDSEQLSGDQFDSLYRFYRDMYRPVTEEDLEGFTAQFRGSAEELAEVLQYYQRYKGDMERVFQWVMCSAPEVDSHRFMDAIDAAIASKEVKRYKEYTAWAKKTGARPLPGDPLAPPSKKKKGGKNGKGGDEAVLIAQIRGKQAQASSFDRMLHQISSRYGGEERPEPSEEEFQAARRKMEERKAGGESAEAAGGSGGKRSGGKEASSSSGSKKVKR